MMRWDESTTYTFVKEYLKRSCLYKNRCRNVDKKLLKEREEALEELVAVMNIPDFGIREAEAKLKSLRSTYCQEYKKVKDSIEHGTDPVYVPVLKWYNMYHAAIRGNKNEPINKLDVVEVEETLTPNPKKYKNTIYVRKKMPRVLDDNSSKHPSYSSLSRAPEVLKESTSRDTEFDVFARSIAVQLNSMPKILALKAQGHIQNYVTNLRIQHLTNVSVKPERNGLPPSDESSSSPSPTPNDHSNYIYVINEKYLTQDPQVN